MKREKDFSDILDDDFEVTYEDGWEDVYEDQIYDKYHDRYSEESHSPRRRNRRGVPLAAPIRKGGRVLSHAASALIRSLTAVLILVTAVYVTYTFWRASAPYGDIAEAVRTRNISMALAAYICVAVIFLLSEFIALIWSMTRVRVRDDDGWWKEDSGRGLFSFVLVFASSYLAFLLYRFLPGSPEVLFGLKGALEVYGSMHNVLFGLCAAGVVSCLVRKYFSH